MKFVIVLLRWLLAGGCAYFAARNMMAALKCDGIAAAPYLFFGIGSFLVAILLISPETVVKLCEFCSRPLTNLVYPNARAERPPLSYRLAHFYTKQLRYAEAVAEYQKIILYYPRERPAYLELLALARRIDHEKLHAKYAKLYMKRFKDVPFAEERGAERLLSDDRK
jgi:hypothetical protein